MKNKILLLIYLTFFFANTVYSQDMRFDSLLNGGKAEFKKDTGNNYALAISYLNKAILIKPENAEAHYFLGYAYSRINSEGGGTIPLMKLPLVIKASEQLQTVIKLSPNYQGEIIVLDPYSKLTSEWGAMAASYLYHNKTDSAIWALKEGKKRGGFDDFILSETRLILESCSKNSIIVVCGDNFFFPFLYLQNVESLRKDISMVEVDILSSSWYPDFLTSNSDVQFDIPGMELDTLDYKQWSDSTVSIPVYGTSRVFKWVLKPSYENQYILRQDRLLLSLLMKNKFKYDVYFTKGFVVDEELSLTDSLLEFPLVDKLSVHNERPWDTEQIFEHLKQWSLELKPANKYSPFEGYPIDHIRSNVINQASYDIDHNQHKEAAKLINALETYLPEKNYPTTMDNFGKCVDSLKKAAN